MFEGKTYEELLKSALSRVPPSLDKREGSMVMNGVAPSMAELAQLYIGLDFVFRATYLATAPREYLIKRAADRNMTPYPASAAIFRAEFNIEVPAGARFSCEDLNCEDLNKEAYPLYQVRRIWADKDSQIGAFADLAKAKAACPVGYSVYDKDGTAVYTNKEDKIEMTLTKEQLQKMINDAANKAAKEAVEATVGKHYNKLGEVTQPSYRPMLDKLAAKGYLRGRSGTGADMAIDMYESDIRALVIAGRALEATGLLD